MTSLSIDVLPEIHEFTPVPPGTQLLGLEMKVARALVFTPCHDAILVCQRASDGYWELPGGKYTSNLKLGCRREIAEETGIEIGSLSEAVLYEEGRTFVKDGVKRRYMASVMLAEMVSGPGAPQPQEREVAKAIWLPFNEGSRRIREDQMLFRPDTVPAINALLPELDGRYDWRIGSVVRGIADAILYVQHSSTRVA